MRETYLRKYAKLIVKVGINLKKEQEVVITAALDQPHFIELLVEECYKLGASKVTVEWSHQPITMLGVNNRSLESLSTVETWEREKLAHRASTLPAMIHILSEDPDGLDGMDQQKNAAARSARYQQLKKYYDDMDNKYQWCIAAVPGEAWAQKVFPGIGKRKAMEKLWRAILYTCRITDENGRPLSPIKEWKKHNEGLAARCEHLNNLQIRSLRYSASNGTDLVVGMMDDGVFAGGVSKTIARRPRNIWYNPNLPTEEVFTTPKRGCADGIVYSSKPLSYCGETIENFSIRFEGGKAVEARAEKGEEALRAMLATDEGAAYLGECALVPQDSPICKSGITFINTLFDENAACHLALGSGFCECVRNYESYTIDECRARGVNDSAIHVDFMIGTPDLSITAVCADGSEVQIFKDGNWAF